MADRNVYGNDFSENGWRMVDQGSCVWVKVPGTNDRVSLQIREGQPVAILGAFVADWNAYVEPVRDADSACWTATNSVGTSNHLSGTACDVCWQSHPFRVANAGFNDAQLSTMRDMLKFYEGMVFWGNDWQSPKDAMHVQMGYDTYGSDNVAKVNDFIARKIRPDGFSTFRRTGAGTPPVIKPPVITPPTQGLTRAEGYAVRIIAEGRRRNITPRGIQIALSTGIVESNITVYANEKLPKSLDLPHDAVGRDGLSVGIFQQQVKNTGNGWWWGDEATCMGVESSAGLFYDRLAKTDYNGPNSPGSYAQAIQRSAYPARYDEKMPQAVALYNKLSGTAPAPAPAPQEDQPMSAEAERQIKVIYDELTKRFPSRSPLRHVGEGPVDTLAGFVLNTDGNQHVEIVTRLAKYNDPDALNLLREVAGNTEAGREHDAQIAQSILAEVYDASQGATATVRAPEPIAYTALAPLVQTLDTTSTSTSTGQVIGQAYDALEALKNAQGALTPEARASVDSLINVLKTEGAAS